jgi:hypothetical protein
MKVAKTQALVAIISTLPQLAEPKFVRFDKAPSDVAYRNR